MPNISLITAMTKKQVIGKDGKMPWHIRDELMYFKQTTMGKPMVMGRKTFDSIGRRLLPGRQTIILSTIETPGEGYQVARNTEEALRLAGDVPELMIIGGATLYEQFLPLANKLYISWIKQDYAGDTYFPKLDWQQWQLETSHEVAEFKAEVYCALPR